MTFRIKKLIYHSEIFLVSADKLTIQVFKVLVEVRPDLQFQLWVHLAKKPEKLRKTNWFSERYPMSRGQISLVSPLSCTFEKNDYRFQITYLYLSALKTDQGVITLHIFKTISGKKWRKERRVPCKDSVKIPHRILRTEVIKIISIDISEKKELSIAVS